MPEPTLSDSYIPSRDGGLRYAYRASWFRDGTHLYWRAKVKRDDALKGWPAGKIAGIPVGSEAIAVRSLVENAIELRARVENYLTRSRTCYTRPSWSPPLRRGFTF